MKLLAAAVIISILLYKCAVVSWVEIIFKLDDETEPEPVSDPFQDITQIELEQLAASWMKDHNIKHWYIISRIAPPDVLKEIITDNKGNC